MQLTSDYARVRVPATSANLGPGYDSLGLALDIYDEVEVHAVTGPTTVIVEGAGAGQVPTDETHLVVRALRIGLEIAGAPQVGLKMHCRNQIPQGRGLGSSASAAVCGLVLARGLVDDPSVLDDKTVLALATDLEGHPDNVAPAVYGGATVAWMGDEAGAAQIPIPEDFKVTAFIPDFELATNLARSILPAEVPHAAAAFNAGRAALLVLALQGRKELFLPATEDKLHQEYRKDSLQSSWELMNWLRFQDLPAVISGAGPAVLTLGEVPEEIRAEVTDSGWKVRTLTVPNIGAVLHN